MSDPVYDAAARAMKAVHGYSKPNRDMQVAAREALEPVQKVYREWKDVLAKEGNPGIRAGLAFILSELAPVIFPDEDE